MGSLYLLQLGKLVQLMDHAMLYYLGKELALTERIYVQLEYMLILSSA